MRRNLLFAFITAKRGALSRCKRPISCLWLLSFVSYSLPANICEDVLHFQEEFKKFRWGDRKSRVLAFWMKADYSLSRRISTLERRGSEHCIQTQTSLYQSLYKEWTYGKQRGGNAGVDHLETSGLYGMETEKNQNWAREDDGGEPRLEREI